MVIKAKLVFREKRASRLILFVIFFISFTIMMSTVAIKAVAVDADNVVNTVIGPGQVDGTDFDYDKWTKRGMEERNYILSNVLFMLSVVMYINGVVALLAVLYDDTVLCSSKYGILKNMGFTHNMLTRLVYIRYMPAVVSAMLSANVLTAIVFKDYYLKMFIYSIIMLGIIVLEIAYFATKVNIQKGCGDSSLMEEDDNFNNESRMKFVSKKNMLVQMALRGSKTYKGFGIILVMIVAILVVTCNFSSVFCYNSLIKTEKFTANFFVNASDIDILWKDRQSRYDNEEKLLEHFGAEIEKAVNFVDTEVGVGGMIVDAFVSDDFTDIDSPKCYKGRSPLHENEIALGYAISKRMNADIGDEIKVVLNEYSEVYLVTGLLQSADMGLDCELTTGGMLRINPEFDEALTSVYLKGDNKGNKVKECTDIIDKYYNDSVMSWEDKYSYCHELLYNYKTMIKIITIIVVVLALLITRLYLNLALRGFLQSRRGHMDVMRVYGFNNRDISIEQMLGIMVFVILGAVIGGIMSAVVLPLIYGKLFMAIGIVELDFMYPGWLIFIVAASVLLYIAVFTITFIRKRSTYDV